jgi:hypothetical protein
LSLPDELRPWAKATTVEIAAAIAATATQVVGKLADLSPPGHADLYRAPEDAKAGELLAAAVDGLTGISMTYVEARWALALTRRLHKWQRRWPRLLGWLQSLESRFAPGS